MRTAGGTATPGAGVRQPPADEVWGGQPVRRPGLLVRRRSWALAAAGVLVTLGSAVGGLVVWNESGATRELLVAARPIPAGHVVELADLRAVDVGGAEGVSSVAASDAVVLVGRAASVPVAAGALIPSDLVSGAGVLPPPGRVVVSVAVAPGVVPPQAGPGASVRVLPIPPAGAPLSGRPDADAGVTGATRGWEAVLLGVQPSGSSETSVVSLQVADVDAAGVAAAGTAIAVVVLPGPR